MATSSRLRWSKASSAQVSTGTGLDRRAPTKSAAGNVNFGSRSKEIDEALVSAPGRYSRAHFSSGRVQAELNKPNGAGLAHVPARLAAYGQGHLPRPIICGHEMGVRHR